MKSLAVELGKVYLTFESTMCPMAKYFLNLAVDEQLKFENEIEKKLKGEKENENHI